MSRFTENVLVGRLLDPSAEPAENRTRLRFAAMFVTMGCLHFLRPAPFVKIVPRWVPWPRGAVFWSGVAELGAGVLLAVPRTRRAGGCVAAATLLSVYPANIQMALDATRSGPRSAALAAWVRLPFQIPMVIKALRYTR